MLRSGFTVTRGLVAPRGVVFRACSAAGSGRRWSSSVADSTEPPKLLVAGLGVTGLTTGLCLHAAGAQVDMVHGSGGKLFSTLSQDEWHSTVLNRNAMAVYRFLGLYDDIANGPHTTEIARHVIQHGGSAASSATVLSTANMEVSGDAHECKTFSVQTAWLKNLLLRKARRSELYVPSSKVSMHKLGLVRKDGKCHATFLGGKSEKLYDSVIATDGAESHIRLLVFVDDKMKQGGYQMCHTVIPRPADVHASVQLENWDPMGKRMVLTPLAKNELLVSVASAAKFDPKYLKAGLRPVSHMTKSLVTGPNTGGVRSVIEALKKLPKNHQCAVEYPGTLDVAKWYEYQTLLFGNTGACPEPFMGLRQSTEIESAWFLAQSVSTACADGAKTNIHDAIRSYVSTHKKRVGKVLEYCQTINREGTKRVEHWPGWRKLKLRMKYSSRAVSSRHNGLLTGSASTILKAVPLNTEKA